MHGTWRTNPQPNPLKALLGIVALVVVVGIGLVAHDLQHEVAKLSPTSTPTPTPTASASAHR